MAIKISNSTIIDDSRNIVNAGIATLTSVSIGNTQVISSERQLQNISSLDAVTTATIESAISNAPNSFSDLNVTGVSTLGVTSTTSLRAQQLNVSGITTLGVVTAGNIFSTGIITATTFAGNLTGNVTGNLNSSGVNTATTLSGTTVNYTTGNFTTGNIVTGVVTTLSGTNLNYGGIGTITTLNSTNATLTNINSSGISTLGVTSATSLRSQQLNVSGVTTTTILNVGTGGTIITTTSDGRIGIGSVIPSSTLSVGGTITEFFNGQYWNVVTQADIGIGASQISLNGMLGDMAFQNSTGVEVDKINVGTGGTIITTTSDGRIGIGTTNPTAKVYIEGDTYIAGILTANRIFSNVYGEFTGGGISGTNIVGTALSISGISTFTSGPVLIGSATSTGTASQPLQVTGGAYVSGNLGIGTTNPTVKLHVQGDTYITGAIYDSTNSTGTLGQVLQSTETGTQWTTSTGGGSGIAAKFDTSIDNVIYFTPTGTLDRVGVGTTTQTTTIPSTPGNDYIVHSIHATNISNGDVEITAAFDIDALKVSAIVSAGNSGIHTCTVSSASSISVGMAFTGTNVNFNTFVTDISGTMIVLNKPLLGPLSGTGFFTPVSKVVSRLPVPVGSAVELLKQPFVLYPSDSIRVQATGLGTVGVALSTTANGIVGFATIGVSTFTGIAAGQLVVGSGIATNTYVGVGYTPGTLIVPITRTVRSTLSNTPVQFIDSIVPQDGSLHTTIVYQKLADTSYLNGTSNGVGVGTTAIVYYGTGNTYPSVVQSIRVSNISDSGDYPVWVGIGNSDTIFTYLAYNLIVPKNSSIELCEAPKRLGIGQSIFAFSDTLNSIEIQIAGKQKI